jgi:hypothetical protein
MHIQPEFEFCPHKAYKTCLYGDRCTNKKFGQDFCYYSAHNGRLHFFSHNAGVRRVQLGSKIITFEGGKYTGDEVRQVPFPSDHELVGCDDIKSYNVQSSDSFIEKVYGYSKRIAGDDFPILKELEGDRQDELTEVIRRETTLDTPIMCLQECPGNILDDLESTGDYEVMDTLRQSLGDEYMAVVIRRKPDEIKVVRTHEFMDPTRRGKRIALACEIEKMGVPIVVATVHLSVPRTANQRRSDDDTECEVEEHLFVMKKFVDFLSRFKGKRVWLCGDFNMRLPTAEIMWRSMGVNARLLFTGGASSLDHGFEIVS